MPSRRSFLRSLISGLILLLPFKAMAKKVAFKLSKAPKLKEVGGSMVIKLKGRPVLFVRNAKESLKAIHAVCTHRKCTVGYNRESTLIECPCHSSAFSLEGKVHKGPASAPLVTYPAVLQGERVVVNLE